MKILIAGGCGFIGSNLSIYLKKLNHTVFSADKLSKNYCHLNKKRLLSNKIKNFKVDISKSNQLSKIKFKPDIIIDCAAEPAVELSFKYPEKIIHNNFLTTLNLLNFAIKNKSKIIFLS